MRSLTIHVALFAAAATSSVALAQPHMHEEIQVGVNTASNKLQMHTHAPMPFMLEESPFPGIDGYANAETALASLDADHPAINLFMLPPTADIRAILVSADPLMQTFNGPGPMQPGEEFFLGSPVIHFLPVWNLLPGAQFGQEYGIRFKFHDASGQFADSDVFELRFTPVPAPAGVGIISLGLLAAGRRRR